MKIQLQEFIHKLSTYARPNQSWVCGKQAQGYSCEAGPDEKGGCRTEYECTPYKDNNGWVCTRSHAYGGRCNDGPFPDGQCSHKIAGCMPTASIRKKKALLVKWTVFVTLALIVLLLNSQLKASFFSPGDLSFKHAKIEQCSACHAVFDRTFLVWIKHALSANKMIYSSQKCLDCHQFGEHAFNAHGLNPENLQQLLKGGGGKVRQNNEKQIACLTCHREHHGADFDLTAVTQQNCALCHDLEQSVFNQKHPQFDHYPYQRNTRIIFDHTTHAKKYYYNKRGDQRLESAPEYCVSCHQSDVQGIKMQQGTYDENCKACHNELFEEAESFFVIEIPEIAIDKVADVEWPEDANGVLTNFMILLLATEPLFIEAVADLDEYHDLTDLDRQKTLQLIKAIKNLFYEFDNKGPFVFKQRLASAFNCKSNEQGQFETDSGCQINESELDQLVNLVPVNLICEGKQRWFPNLASDYPKTSENEQTPLLYCDKKNQHFEMNSQQGEWLLDDFSIEYRPVAHGDQFIKVWLNLSSLQIHLPLAEKVRMQLFSELSSEDASVQCTKCHSVESNDGKNFIVNWQVEKAVSTAKGFVKFKHDDHIKYQDETICNDCHHENNKTDYLAGYDDQNPLTFVSNFVTENKDCSSCHQQSMTKDQCQKCHNYHVSAQ